MSGKKVEQDELRDRQKDLDRKFQIYCALAFLLCAGYFLAATAQLEKEHF